MTTEEEMLALVRQDKEPLIIGKANPVKVELEDLVNLLNALNDSNLEESDKLRIAAEKVLGDLTYFLKS